ncbi:hypothetical protein B296_00032973 [Ensete ventricosum]|uniref:Uncharacterized protein n=1 Tax=Ensete ventricosum TaxID=4639 RepID=A0A426Y0G1_ENSVE|nr:hypothetical protein B296_00032973 [Ensete ventricosum]
MPGHTADGTHADCSMCAKLLLLLLLLEEPGKAKEVCMRPALVFKVVQPLLKLYGEYTVSSISSYLAPFPLPLAVRSSRTRISRCPAMPYVLSLSAERAHWHHHPMFSRMASRWIATRNSPSQKQSYPEKLSASAGVLLQSIVKRLRDDVPSLRAAVGVELYLMVDLRQLKIILIVEIDDLK